MPTKEEIFNSASTAKSIKDNPYSSNPNKSLWEKFYFQTRDYEIEKEMIGEEGYESHSWGSYDANANLSDSPRELHEVKVYEDYLFFPSNNVYWAEQFNNRYLNRKDVLPQFRNRKGFDALSDWMMEDSHYLRSRYKMLGQIGFPDQDPDFPCISDKNWAFLNLIMEMANVGNFEKNRLLETCVPYKKLNIKKSQLTSRSHKINFGSKDLKEISHQECPRFVKLGKKLFKGLGSNLTRSINILWDEGKTPEEQDEEFLFFFVGRHWKKPVVLSDLVNLRMNFSKWFNFVVERPCGVDAEFENYWNKPFTVNYNFFGFYSNVFSQLWSSLVDSLKQNNFNKLDQGDKMGMLNHFLENKENWTSSKKFNNWKIETTQNFNFDAFCYGVLEDQIITLAFRLATLCPTRNPYSYYVKYWKSKVELEIGDSWEKQVDQVRQKIALA